MDRSSFSVSSLKLADVPASGRVTGIACLWGVRDLHGDILQRGCFSESLAARKAANRPMPRMLAEHGGSVPGGEVLPVGTWSQIEDRADGLHVTGQIAGAADTERGRSIIALIEAGALSQLSVGFRIAPGGATQERDGRLISKGDLAEISLVSDAAQPGARLQLKTAGDLIALLREQGIAKAAAKRIAAGGWSALAGESLTDEADPDEVAALAAKIAAASNSLRSSVA